MPNLSLRRKRNLSPWRRLALGTWGSPSDASVYGGITVRVDEALRYMEAFRAATGIRLTMTHLVAKAAAAALEAVPDANAILRWGRLYLRDEISIAFQVAMRDERTEQIDLSAAVIRRPEQKSLAEIARELDAKFNKVRRDVDSELARSRSVFRRVPPPLVGAALRAVSFASYTLNLDLRRLGVPRDAFGSMMITNIGALGLPEAYPPLVPYSRVPILVTVGSVEDAPVVEDGQVVPGKVMRITASFDHRVLDGAHVAKMVRTVKAWLERPFEHLDAIGGLAAELPQAQG
jgi:hypothetical protein